MAVPLGDDDDSDAFKNVELPTSPLSDDLLDVSGSAVGAAGDESGFWLFEFVVVSVLVPAVWYWRKRKQYVLAMHHRRLDRMVNS